MQGRLFESYLIALRQCSEWYQEKAGPNCANRRSIKRDRLIAAKVEANPDKQTAQSRNRCKKSEFEIAQVDNRGCLLTLIDFTWQISEEKQKSSQRDLKQRQAQESYCFKT